MNIFDELAKPFPENSIHWRAGATNKRQNNGTATKAVALAYIDARDVMERLDMVVGPANWQCRYPFVGCCEIGLKIDGEWVWRSNGAGQTDMEGEKGQYSDSFKRAGVMWGIGRYLYGLPNEWYDLDDRGRFKNKPRLPDWATPGGWHRIPIEQRRTVYDQTLTCLESGDELGLREVWNEWQADQKAQLWSMFDSVQRETIKQLVKDAA